jgi:uncharacterized protein YdeI (YjbR/CyaY-like superfamily)
MRARFFRTGAAFHAWMEKNHETKAELLVGFHKKASGKTSVTYPEALDGPLVFGWIDGIRRGMDEPKAWAFFDAQAPWYKRNCAHWVSNAKRPETREKRLRTLLECSRQGKRIPPLSC